jgi:hypothetical protein
MLRENKVNEMKNDVRSAALDVKEEVINNEATRVANAKDDLNKI